MSQHAAIYVRVSSAPARLSQPTTGPGALGQSRANRSFTTRIGSPAEH